MLTEKTLFHRNLVTMILVAFFAIVICVLCLVVIFTHIRVEKERDLDFRMNVLFIVVDDLRPTLGCYGDQRAITPNIDQLASKSVLFTNAYAQQALCAPSRTSFLTSRRPDTLHLYHNGDYWRETRWNFTTLPEHFKDNGYETISVGKVFHHGSVSGDTDDYPYSWSREPFRPPTLDYKMSPVCPTPDGNFMNLICPVDVTQQPGGTLPDLEVVDYAIEYLNNKSLEYEYSPFFLGVGFYKPHIPFKYPQEYSDLYPIESMDLAANNTKPEFLPSVAWNPWTDLRLRHDLEELNVSFPFGPIPDDFQKLIRQGYYASTSYMDDQVGRLLEALEKNGFASNTAIVLVGDHGWSLGEHGEWSKYSNFDVAVRVPLLFHIPEVTHKATKPFRHITLNETLNREKPKIIPDTFRASHVTHEFVELVDLFPTLSETVKIAIPLTCPLTSYTTTFCSEGVSFYPLVQELELPSENFSWKEAVFSQYPRPSIQPQNDSDQPQLKRIKIMGYTIRDQHYRFTRWVKFDNYHFQPIWAISGFVDDELYDIGNDPQELNDLADNSKYADTVRSYYKKLRKGWRYAVPFERLENPSRKHKRIKIHDKDI